MVIHSDFRVPEERGRVRALVAAVGQGSRGGHDGQDERGASNVGTGEAAEDAEGSGGACNGLRALSRRDGG